MTSTNAPAAPTADEIAALLADYNLDFINVESVVAGEAATVVQAKAWKQAARRPGMRALRVVYVYELRLTPWLGGWSMDGRPRWVG